MKNLTRPIIQSRFSESLGKTIISTDVGDVFAKGDVSKSPAILVNITVNEIGDTFVARKDSKTMKEGTTDQPIYLAGDTVTRETQSLDFRSLAGLTQAASMMQAAAAFGFQGQIVVTG
jgi:hypothetical protein